MRYIFQTFTAPARSDAVAKLEIESKTFNSDQLKSDSPTVTVTNCTKS